MSQLDNPDRDQPDTYPLEQYLGEQRHHCPLRLMIGGLVDEGRNVLIGRELLPAGGDLVSQLTTLRQALQAPRGSVSFPELTLLDLGPKQHDRVEPPQLPPDRTSFVIGVDAASEQHQIHNLVQASADTDLGVVIIDAREGITERARRCILLASLAGLRHLVVIISEMGEVGFSQEVHQHISEGIRHYADLVGMNRLSIIPASISSGDNMSRPSESMHWYRGSTLRDLLEGSKPDVAGARNAPFRMLIKQTDERAPGSETRCIYGQAVSGVVRPGDRVRVQPSGKDCRVSRVFHEQEEVDLGLAGQSLTITLADGPDVPPGSVISAASSPVEVADQFAAHVIWTHRQPLFPGRHYLMSIGNDIVECAVTDIRYEINVDTLEQLAADKLEINGIAVCNLSLDRPVPFTPYRESRDLGGFTLVDRLSNETMGVGMLNFALRRAHNIHLQHVDVDKTSRSRHKGHKPCVLWFTGLPGSGKSTVANLVERKLHQMGVHTYLLDGDNVRHGLSRDLGFTDADRVENIRRVAEVSKLMVDAGLIVITAFISPFRAERRMARQLMETGEFIEVFTDTPLDVAEQRDPKGLYKKARRGDLKNFTGIDSPYEQPEAPEIRLDTDTLSPETAADMVIQRLKESGILRL